MCRVFNMFKVKVPVIFSSTEGLLPRRDGRYTMLSDYIKVFYCLVFLKTNASTKEITLLATQQHDNVIL